ncbi:hypothetical protein, partial [Cronobacter sakazakii]|uniref:hypothetical protein n=1 Tax=Cronobacter sakazakii TaxID=28141 RepID=UPI0011B2631E
YSKKEPELTLRLFCFYIAPGKRQVRSAYLPYKTCRRVGKRKRTHLPATEKTQKIKTKKAQHTLGFYVVISGELNRRR